MNFEPGLACVTFTTSDLVKNSKSPKGVSAYTCDHGSQSPSATTAHGSLQEDAGFRRSCGTGVLEGGGRDGSRRGPAGVTVP